MNEPLFVQNCVERLSRIPVAFDWLRWLLEAGFVSHRQLIAESLGKSPSHILDCGCGTGIFAQCFSPKGYVGIDLATPYINRARQRFSSYRFDVMDAKDLQFNDESFDTVIIAGMLHHMPDKEAIQVLQEVKRVLQPGGHLLLWEDVPTRSSFNWVGKLVHRLDLGEHIRQASEYRFLVGQHLQVERIKNFRSGFMDYVALLLRKQLVRSISPTDSPSTLQATSILGSD